MRHPNEAEMAEAREAYNKWRSKHENLARMPRAREIFYHGYLTRLLEKDDV
jgi:hypothetical protein